MVRIYHNPRCNTSRNALKLLRDRGVEPEIVEYLKTPPDAATLDGFLKKLGLEPRELMRRKEAPYKELHLDDPGTTRAQLIKAMVDNPILIERPIVVNKGKVVLGRPAEKVLEVL
jgi:arsenate reductase